MALIDLNLKPSKKDLTFFTIFGASFCLIMALVFYLLNRTTAPQVLLGIAAALLASRLVSLALTRWIYIIATIAAFPIGWIISHLVMAIFYYGILTPLGLVFRLMGRDPLQRHMDPKTDTYWTPHQAHNDPARYFRQF